MDRKQIGWSVVTIVTVLAALFFGVRYPLPEQPAEQLAGAGVNVRTEKALNIERDLDVGNNVTVDGAVTIGGYPPVLSTLLTNAAGIANSVTAASNALVFEGATGNSYQLNLVAADPAGSDKTITLPNINGEVMLSNGWDVAQGWWVQGQDFNFEGSSADGNEFTFRAPSNPGADIILSAPAFSGYVATNSAAVQTIYGSSVVTGTATLAHGLTTPLYAFCSLGADPVDNEEDRCTVLISGSTVTAKVWKEAASPTAGDSGVAVYWSVVGTP